MKSTLTYPPGTPVLGPERRAERLAYAHLIRACQSARDDLAWSRFEASADDDAAVIERAMAIVSGVQENWRQRIRALRS